LFLCNGDEEKSRNGDTDLCLNSVKRVAPEDLNFEMLFNPFEKELNLPTMLVQVGDGLSGDGEVVGEVDVGGIGFFVIVFDSS